MEAYAKLEGRVGVSDDDDDSKREFLITELPCSLGRAQCSEGGSIVIDCNDVLLSRQHVQITWSQEAGWILTCLSKNGCTVDKKRYGKAAEIGLRNGSAIRIGNARLYFTLPLVEDIVGALSSPDGSSKKRAYSETLPETDGEEGDLLMAMPGNAFSPSSSATSNNSR
jgi:predicted component of type VI protein secretion system